MALSNYQGVRWLIGFLGLLLEFGDCLYAALIAREQIVKKLRTASEEQARGMNIEEVCRKLEISVAIDHRWSKEYGGAKTETVKRLKELEKENARLKKLVAEQALDVDMLKEINRGKW